jgi:diguanylate cyclase (GGDEF)-like protein
VAAWLAKGTDLSIATRIVVTSLPVAVVMLAVSAALLRRHADVKPLPSQRLAAILFAFHGTFFAVRALVTALWPGTEIALWSTNIMLTMFEGVLWSVSAPMTLLVLVREKTERQLLEASQIDYLTGLDNRRGLVRKAERAFAQSLAADRPLVLVIFDLDHFKSINDRYGHQTGDRVLELFSRVAEAEMRPQDILARLGGEEFAVLFPDTEPEAARSIAARICRQFAATVAEPDGMNIKATASAGLAGTQAATRTLDDLMMAADRALYRAKELGRDRIEQAAPREAIAA